MPDTNHSSRRRLFENRVTRLLEDCARYLPQGALYLPFAASSQPRFTPNLPSFCRRCLENPATAQYCRRSITGAAFQALQTGEPYYFRCWSGLNTVVAPVASGRRLTGAFETGVFHYPGDRDEDRRFAARNIANTCPTGCEVLLERLETIPERSPLEVRGMADFLFEGLFSSGLNDVAVFRELHEKYLQQRRIGELMQAYGDRAQKEEEDLFDLFPALAGALRRGDTHQSMLLMDGFFSRVMLSTGLNTEGIKAHIHLLLAFLARESVLQDGMPLDRAVIQHFHYFRELDELSDLTDICYWTFVHVRRVMTQRDGTPASALSIGDRVLRWIEKNFSRRDATLAAAARAVGASISGIVHALPRDTGLTFHEHLTAARIQEARRLLIETDEPLAAVALYCGFCDQSHLSRVFKAQTKMTPGRYRRLASP